MALINTTKTITNTVIAEAAFRKYELRGGVVHVSALVVGSVPGTFVHNADTLRGFVREFARDNVEATVLVQAQGMDINVFRTFKTEGQWIINCVLIPAIR